MRADLTIHIVEPGTGRIDPETQLPWTIDDSSGVLDRTTGQVWMTRRQYDLLKELTGTAQPGGAA
jgi:hypothetical protein